MDADATKEWPQSPKTLPSLKPTLDDVMRRRSLVSQSKQSLLWASINGLFFLLILIDARYSLVSTFFSPNWIKSAIYISDILLACIVFLNTVYDFGLYVWLVFWMKPIELTATEMRLFGINGDEIGFKECSPVEQKSPISTSIAATIPFDISLGSDVGGLSARPSLNSTTLSNMSTPNSSISTPSTSWVYNRFPNVSLSATPSPKADESLNFLRLRKANSIKSDKREPSITSESELIKYLNEFDEKEERYEEILEAEKRQERTNANSQWSFNETSASNLLDDSVTKNSYQYAIDSPSRSSSEQIDSIYSSPSSSSSKAIDAVIIKLKINETKMNQWIENIRKWISQTILARFVSEINKINDALIKIGNIDSLIGEASLPLIKQIATLKKSQIPSLDVVVPYLEISVNQQYLVKRIRDLAKGGCIGEFIWNSGGMHNTKQWNEDLPTDSHIIMHFFCTYMDSCLPSNPNSPEGKSFTNQHFCSFSGQSPKSSIYISQAKINPPHYKVVTKDEDVWELPIGRNNLFHALLVFLHCVKQKNFGLLGRINLGASGVNVLWVVDDK